MHIKKYILLSVLIGNVFLFAQEENKSQSIELPAFVITGIQSVSVPTMKKMESEFVPIVNNKFLIPNYDTEELSLIDNSSPIKKVINLTPPLKNYNGLLKLGAGLQTMPTGNLYFGFNKSNYLFNSHVFGSDTRDFVEYSGYNTSGAKIKFNYFVNHRARVLPGLSIGVEGNFIRDQYNFYGTSSPEDLRENFIYGGKLLLSNNLSKVFQYGVNISSHFLNMKADEAKENMFSGEGFFEFNKGYFGFGGSGNYKVQSLDDNTLVNERTDYFGGKAYLKFSNSKMFELKIGAHYSKLDTNNIFAPIAILSVFIDEGLAMFISYEGNSEFIMYNDFLTENRYFKRDIRNIFQKNNSNIKAVLKYEILDILEINTGFHTVQYDNYNYFEDLNNDSRFNVVVINEVKEIGGFFSMIINSKKYGELFANVEFQNITDVNDNKIPYKPMLTGDLSYGYMFSSWLYSKLKFKYSRSAYTNLSNTQDIPSYFNLGLYLKYSLFNNLAATCDLQNLLNRKNYLLKNYQEKPLDVIVGIEYRW